MTDLVSRRLLLGASLAAPLGFAAVARADDTPALPPGRALGNPNAKVVVQEWYSLTCTHCAHFAETTFPEVKAKLIDTGRIRYVFRDFPLDQVAVMAAVVARALPEAQYEPFIIALLSNQQSWAFGQDVNPQAQLQKMAALAGLSPAAFNKAINDPAGQQAVLAEASYATKVYNVDSTPTFVFNKDIDRQGDMSYADFEKRVAAAGG